MKYAKLICEGTEEKMGFWVSVKPDSSDEKWFYKNIAPVLKDKVIIRLGDLFGEEDNTYIISPEDYERVKTLIDKRKSNKEIVTFAAKLIGGVVGAVAMYYICDAIKNHF